MAERRLGRYELVRPLGRGATGDVWEAVLHGPLGFRKRVALKLLRGDRGSDLDLVREARLGAQLSHPNVVSVLELGQVDGTWFVSMELVRGASAAALLRAGALPVGAALDIAIQVGAGLAHVHAERLGERVLVHRDVKPANVLVDRTGVAKLADLGIAALAAQLDVRAAGTPAFMAPEQRAGRAEPASDVFSLGATVFCLVVGHPPFDASRPPEAVDEALAGGLLRPVEGRCGPLAEVLTRCLRHDPEARWSTARLVGGLREVRAALPPSAGSLAVLLDERLQGVRAAEWAGPATPGVAPRRGEATAPLPEPPGPFVGRALELEALTRRLEAPPGLVTLLGPAGVGKTRLALRAARRAGSTVPIVLAPLGEARGADEVSAAVARALGVALVEDDPTAQLERALAGRGPLVLVCDDAEGCVEPLAERVVAWRTRASDLLVLVTSRVPLGLPDEERIQVEPLAVDDAAALFTVRAERPLDADDRTRLPSMVERLDGLPLAIELAAARTRVLSVRQLDAQLERRFQVLTSAGRGRHATLEAALDGSWELLPPWARAAWAQLSVAIDLDLEAVDALLDLSAFPDAPWTLDVLARLSEHSLIRVHRERFSQLPTLREYGRRRLEAQRAGLDRPPGAALRHASHLAPLGSEAALERGPAAPGRARTRLRELDNLIAATRSAAAAGDGAVAGRVAIAAIAALAERGPLQVARALAAELAHLEMPPDVRARLRCETARVELYGGQLLVAIRLASEASADWRRAGARASGARAQVLEAMLRALHGELDQAEHLLEGSREAIEAEGTPTQRAAWLASRAELHRLRGDADASLRDQTDALERFRAAGDAVGVARSHGSLGLLYGTVGRYGEARHHLAQSLAGWRALGVQRSEAVVRSNLAHVQMHTGQLDAARRQLEHALDLYREIGMRAESRAYVLLALAEVCLIDGAPTEARTHVDRAREILGPRPLAPRREAQLRRTEAQLALREGHTADAVRHARRAVELVREGAPRSELALSLARLAAALVECGSEDEGRAAIDEAAALAEDLGPDSEAVVAITEAAALLGPA